MTDITELAQSLKAAAEKASNGDWVKESGDGWEACCSANDQANGGFIIAHFVGPDAAENREFVQAANPANVLALVEALEYYKSREERVTSLVRDNSKSWDELYRQVEAKGKRNVELVEALESEKRICATWRKTAEANSEKLEKAQQRNAELEAQNEYIRKRYQQLDLLIGKNILVMQAAIIEWQATGDAKNGLAWIYNTLFGPGELPDEAEKDAQAYFDRKYAPLDEELMALHKWFWEQSEAERAAAGIKVEAE
ncbi:ead/Ea22-like family protein [Klebsiella pneumoniae]|uniref:ead/Ea22-like family protein n=1 Tax=Klebsiella pneumoniae TaxID=573 RepID=UPI0021D6678D|nr:ead/Ea22-like family protein [Klebsiella pneumoniae]HBZ0055150.1 ead/Ea22-like family protein [Klebsiella pneumoniae]